MVCSILLWHEFLAGKNKSIDLFHNTTCRLLHLNSANVGLTMLSSFFWVLFNMFPQFLQNQGFIVSISTENEIQVLILVRLSKFLLNNFLSY